MFTDVNIFFLAGIYLSGTSLEICIDFISMNSNLC